MDISRQDKNPVPNDLDWEPVLTTGQPDRLHLCSLILSAADIPHTIRTDRAGNWVIFASSNFVSRATAEITAYDQENQNWPLQPPAADNFNPYFRAQAILIVVSLMLFYAVTGPWTAHSLWFSHGAVDSTQILDHGQYVRLMTGLTLHADLVHLLGNCFLGGFLLHFYFLLIGNGIGLFALTTTACLANYINVVAHGPGHHSVGFSTAVFTVIGILCALNYRHYRLTRPERLLLPLMAGAAMLAMLGSGNGTGRTDLGAHLFGLLAGLGMGTLLGLDRVFRLRHVVKLQFILSLLSLASVVISWNIALRL
ncbi:rhomboid family intramembrane serine protease [Desulfopila aestuarii]|uniref:Membrane associated serine protease, rhomboid family n=1 Tax=Desulfopila aestuarii DSM 18488 TaxID=1121416 RepID=A0A1M7Y0E1_9BACT|nr:rhomboid family intramembrane serine protease [Desulfopila aestuarii]SHO45069.1 Membrane associated serine protease, rhomboid family [Desulfopila aestuarii DSM 18488]